MTAAAKLMRLESALNATARKIYTLIPAVEPIQRNELVSLLAESGVNINKAFVDKFLMDMCESGLIREPRPLYYLRRIPSYVAATRTIEEESPVGNVIVQPEPTLTERFAELSKLLRNCAEQIDLLSLQVEEELGKTDEKLKKLRDLQALLKGLSE